MPTSSNFNQNPSGEIEDIFSESDTGQPPTALPIETPLINTNEPAVDNQMAPDETMYKPPVDLNKRKRLFLLIAIVIGSLLLLGGIGLAVWYWVKLPKINTNSASDTNQPPANIIVNTNTTVNENINVGPADTFIDVDHDGLSDQEELLANTNPKKKDTDDDGLSDREEVRVYLTDPRNPDTDDDGYTDGTEVANFYHPNDPDPKKRLFDLPN